MGTSGGTGTIAGTNFVSGCTAFAKINGTAVALTITFNSSTNLSFVLPAGSYTAGTWDLTVTNPDGQFDVEPIFVVSTSSTPATIFGAFLKGWWIAGVGTLTSGVASTNGGLVDTWQDQSGNGYHLTASGSSRPIFHSTASFCPTGLSYSSVLFDGVDDLLVSSSSGSANIDASTDCTLFIVMKEITDTLGVMWFMFGHPNGGISDIQQRWALGNSSHNPTWYNSAGNGPSWTSVTGAQIFYGGEHNPSGTASQYISVNNAPVANGAPLSPSWVNSGFGFISIGGSTDGSTFSNIEVVEAFIVAGHNPTSAEFKAAVSYLNFKYINRSPSITATTLMYKTGTAFRIKGSNFVNGAIVSFDSSLGVSPVSATFVNSSILEVTMPGTTLAAGSYDITIDNPDGGAITQANGFSVTNNRTATPMTVTGDCSCVGWYDGNSWTLNGSSVSALLDQSLAGNDVLQTTSANQPARILADADFAGMNSWSFDGTQTYLQTASNFGFGAAGTTGNSAFVVASVTKLDASNQTGNLTTWWAPSLNQKSNSGKPQTTYGGLQETWATSTGGLVKALLSSIAMGTGAAVSIDVNNSGSPVSGSTNTMATASPLAMGSQTGGSSYVKAKQASNVIFNRLLTSTEKADLRTWQAGFGA